MTFFSDDEESFLLIFLAKPIELELFWKHSKASVLFANPDDRRFTTIDGMDRWNILLSPVLQIHGSQGPDN